VFTWTNAEQTAFTVREEGPVQQAPVIDIDVNDRETIIVQARNLPNVTATVARVAFDPTSGACRLRVGDEWLDPWQLLHRVLEPLLFR
jgi:hypothetical protein